MNQAELVGRLTADLELRITKKNHKVVHFFLATHRRYGKNTDKNSITADFIPCVAWNGAAECLTEHCQKGSRIGVRGPIQSRSWTTSDGQRKYVMEVRVDEFEFLGKTHKASGVEIPNENLPVNADERKSEGEDIKNNPAVNEPMPSEPSEAPVFGSIVLEPEPDIDEEDDWYPPVPGVF